MQRDRSKSPLPLASIASLPKAFVFTIVSTAWARSLRATQGRKIATGLPDGEWVKLDRKQQNRGRNVSIRPMTAIRSQNCTWQERSLCHPDLQIS